VFFFQNRFLMWNKRNWDICLNHELSSDLPFQSRGSNGWLWTAEDFSEGEGKTKTFEIRFKYPSNSRTFVATVLKNQVHDLITPPRIIKYSTSLFFTEKLDRNKCLRVQRFVKKFIKYCSIILLRYLAHLCYDSRRDEVDGEKKSYDNR